MPRGLILDAIVVTLLLFIIVRGAFRRTLRESIALLGLIVALILAPLGAAILEALLGAATTWAQNVRRLVALDAFILSIALAASIFGWRFTRDLTLPGSRVVDRVGGVVLATMRGLILCCLFFYSLLVVSATDRDLPGFAEGVNAAASSVVLADESSPLVLAVDSAIARSDSLRGLTLAARQQTRLRVTVPSDRVTFAAVEEGLSSAPPAETELLRRLNQERKESGLPPLGWCERCATVARDHSRDMYRKGYFGHVDLSGRDPFERLREAAVAYQAAGENLAIAPTVTEAHEALMTSAQHRANILRERFDEIGIGIVEGPYGLMCTQVFLEAPET
jgi:uncharacterized protein YkwD